MPYDATPRPGSTVDPRDAGPQPYHRLLRNPATAGWTVVLGAFAPMTSGWPPACQTTSSGCPGCTGC